MAVTGAVFVHVNYGIILPALVAFDGKYDWRGQEVDETLWAGEQPMGEFSTIVVESDVVLEPLFIRPERLFDKVKEFVGIDDIDFESAEFSRKFGKTVAGLAEMARDALMSHTWVGNVRELKNCIERGVLTCRGTDLTARDLGLDDATVYPKPSRGEMDLPAVTAEGIDYLDLKRSFERYYLEEALRLAGGNESKAARLLGMNHHTFRYQKKKLDED